MSLIATFGGSADRLRAGGSEVEERNMTEPLLTVPAKEVASKFGYYTDEAMLHPVGIQRHGVTRVVMLSLKEYERLLSRDRQVLRVRDLDDDDIEAIRTAKPSERSRKLDEIMEDARAG
jgi:hypothetical protein